MSPEKEEAPQDLFEKLSQGSGTKGKARRPLSDLAKQRGFSVLEFEAGGKSPRRVRIIPMDTATTWVRVGSGVNGDFEQET